MIIHLPRRIVDMRPAASVPERASLIEFVRLRRALYEDERCLKLIRCLLEVLVARVPSQLAICSA